LQVRRLLHDANSQFYTDADLNDYVNEARLNVCRDTGCFRQLIPVTFTANQEVYPFSLLNASGQAIDIWGISVIFGQTRYKLLKKSFTELDAQIRPYTAYVGMPVAFAMYGENSWFLAPNPDQDYAAEVDAVMYPGDLTDDSTLDTIPLTFQSAVKWSAASLAKEYSEDQAESDRFRARYGLELKTLRASTALRVIHNAYQVGANSAWGR
jgi:hypothetical protein